MNMWLLADWSWIAWVFIAYLVASIQTEVLLVLLISKQTNLSTVQTVSRHMQLTAMVWGFCAELDTIGQVSSQLFIFNILIIIARLFVFLWKVGLRPGLAHQAFKRSPQMWEMLAISISIFLLQKENVRLRKKVEEHSGSQDSSSNSGDQANLIQVCDLHNNWFYLLVCTF